MFGGVMRMNGEEFRKIAHGCFGGIQGNHAALPSEDVEIRVLEEPLVGFAAADDPLFDRYADPGAIGPEWRHPREWMPRARTVAALFFPFSEEVRARHRRSKGPIGEAWNVAYGKHFQVVDEFLDALIAALDAEGVVAVVPTRDASFEQVSRPVAVDGVDDLHFGVSWSNRHAAFAAGLGTFGIHRHIITQKGCCGGLATLVLDCGIAPTERAYTELYEHCTRCGACVRRCPVDAISVERLRNIKTCSEHGMELFQAYRGACGKCLVGIPCEGRNPSRRRGQTTLTNIGKNNDANNIGY